MKRSRPGSAAPAPKSSLPRGQRSRGKGQERIHKTADGRYRWRITIGRDANGRRIRRSGSATTKREAARMLAALLASQQKGLINLVGTRTRPGSGEKLEVTSAIAGHLASSITFDIYRSALEDEMRSAIYRLRDQRTPLAHKKPGERHMTPALTATEAAAYLGVRLPDIYDMLNDRRLTYRSSTLLIPLEEVEFQAMCRRRGRADVRFSDFIAYLVNLIAPSELVELDLPF